MGWHVPRLARDPCKVSGRVRFSSAPQKSSLKIWNYQIFYISLQKTFGWPSGLRQQAVNLPCGFAAP